MVSGMRKRKTVIRRGASDWALDIFVYLFVFVLLVLMLYPFLYVISTSISNQTEVMRGAVTVYPRGFDLSSYKAILLNPMLPISYFNTIIYSIAGTAITLVITAMSAYPLSLKKFETRGFWSLLYVITMFFGGGMIPTFLVVKGLGLYNTRLAMILPGIISAWNIIIMRSFFQSIPSSLHESAYLDGANDWTTLWRIILPLSKAVIATIGLFTFVAIWNDFFSALLYLKDSDKYPLQMILRVILFNSTTSQTPDDQTRNLANISSQGVKSAVIVVAIFPIMCIYPFIQKYFVKGVMIGSIKG